LLNKYNIPAEEFYKQLKQQEFKTQAAEEFALCKQLKVEGFPALFLQTDQTKIYALANGYTNYDTLNARLINILSQQKNKVI
jgi:putative protein-disulfide isomerase